MAVCGVRRIASAGKRVGQSKPLMFRPDLSRRRSKPGVSSGMLFNVVHFSSSCSPNGYGNVD